MKHKPKPKNEGIFAHGLGVKVVIQGVMFAILTLIGFVVGTGLPLSEIFAGALQKNEAALVGGQTLAFMVLALCQIVQAFNMRSEHSLFLSNPFSNKTLNLAALASTALLAIVLFSPVRIAFELTLLPARVYLIGLGLALAPLPAMEIGKLISHLIKKNKENN